jgi:trans-aconitate 2-methyltransferase
VLDITIQVGYKYRMADAWDPVQYDRFAAERRQPFDDLLSLLRPPAGARVVDLGCGAGNLTVELHHHVGAARTTGIDSSPAMLAAPPAAEGVEFEQADLTTWGEPGSLDVVFANASLQWTPDHDRQLARLTTLLRPGGQLAIQVPTNADHPSHAEIARVAGEMPFCHLLDPSVLADPVSTNVLRPERYAELLHHLGFVEQHVRLQVYGHVLPSSSDVVEWTRGTTLTRFAAALEPDAYERFVDRYRERLVRVIGDQRPYFYAFKRILLWGRLP